MEEITNFDLNQIGQQASPEITPEPKGPELKFRARTLFVPLLFGMLYIVIQAVSALGYVFVAHSDKLESAGDAGSADLMRELLLDGNVSVYSNYIMAAVIIPLFYFYIKRRARKYPLSLLGGPVRRRPLLTALAATTVGLLGVNLQIISLEVMSEYVPYIEAKLAEYQQLVGLIIPSNVSPVLIFLAVVILVPICEELLFRGVMMGEFMLAMKKPYAAILTAALFALFHGNFIQSTYVLIPGLILSFAYYLTGSLKVPIILHAWFNFLGGFLPTVMGADQIDNSGSTTFGALIISMYAISIGYLIFVAVKRKQAKSAA